MQEGKKKAVGEAADVSNHVRHDETWQIGGVKQSQLGKDDKSKLKNRLENIVGGKRQKKKKSQRFLTAKKTVSCLRAKRRESATQTEEYNMKVQKYKSQFRQMTATFWYVENNIGEGFILLFFLPGAQACQQVSKHAAPVEAFIGTLAKK